MDAMKIFWGGNWAYVSGVVRTGAGIVVEIMSASRTIRRTTARKRGLGLK